MTRVILVILVGIIFGLGDHLGHLDHLHHSYQLAPLAPLASLSTCHQHCKSRAWGVKGGFEVLFPPWTGLNPKR